MQRCIFCTAQGSRSDKKWLLVGTFDTLCALFAASTWKMARPQVAARWTRRPAPPRGWCCTPPSRGTASAGSPSSTAQTATTTCHQRRCPGTPLSRANSKHKLSSPCVSQRMGALPGLSWLPHFTAQAPEAGALTACQGTTAFFPIASSKCSPFLHNPVEELSRLCCELQGDVCLCPPALVFLR